MRSGTFIACCLLLAVLIHSASDGRDPIIPAFPDTRPSSDWKQYVRAIAEGTEKDANRAVLWLGIEREETIAALKRVIGEKPPEKPDVRVTNAILALGEIQAIGEAELLIRFLGYYSSVPDPKEVVQNDSSDSPYRFPSVPALIKLGPAAVEPLLRAVAENRLPNKKKYVGLIIAGALGKKDGARYISQFCERVPPEQAARVECDEILQFFRADPKSVKPGTPF